MANQAKTNPVVSTLTAQNPAKTNTTKIPQNHRPLAMLIKPRINPSVKRVPNSGGRAVKRNPNSLGTSPASATTSPMSDMTSRSTFNKSGYQGTKNIQYELEKLEKRIPEVGRTSTRGSISIHRRNYIRTTRRRYS